MNLPARVGIIGCGNVNRAYQSAAPRLGAIRYAACADIRREAAENLAAQHNIPRVLSVEEMLADPEIDIILNLTIPGAHYEIALAALEAGKHVYSEKPLSLTAMEGASLVDAGTRTGLRVGNAPDTFLGAGIQTSRKLIDDGAIGRPVAATAFMMSRGHEHWHPSPEFYYKAGGGPMFDMGPYYLTALIALLGPVARVTGSTQISRSQRTISSQPLHGTVIDVDVPTHVVGVLDFAIGAVGTIITSFDVQASVLPRIEIYGTEGTLSVPDPNTFGGPVRLRRAADDDWQEMPLTHGNAEQSRGLGVADLAQAVASGRPHRASGELALHVLEIMETIHTASDEGRHVALGSSCQRPGPFPPGLADGDVDA
ncbi:MAG: Gfo/Idh/MocA family oxidoreductase [Caldilineaceae bacterium]|nr:Gfo/Idh/MocA family oxidoreductase [Caldilineaceae bacterium]